MHELTVKLTHKDYPIYIENGLFDSAGEYIKRFFPNRKAFIITDSNLVSLYADSLLRQLKDLNISAGVFTIPAGESSKSHDQLLALYEAFGSSEITRKDVVIALGGGVTGDLAGFAASTWLRGTRFMQIPTSLLAMVDSSIGGKVAVNLAMGKNLVGSFYHPEAVLIDPLLLKSLPDRHFADGVAEIIKHGCIRDKELFLMLETISSRDEIMKNIEEIIFRNCMIKKSIVEKDERESNLRMILNFGHTFGHALEKAFCYEKYTHGEAVAIGMEFATELSVRLGFCEEEVLYRIRKLLKQFQLPTDWPAVDSQTIRDTVLLDKKAMTNDMTLVLIKDIGNAFLNKYSKDRIGGWIDEKLNP